MGIEDPQLDPNQVMLPEEQSTEPQPPLQDGESQPGQVAEDTYSDTAQPSTATESSNIEPDNSGTSTEQTDEPTHIASIDHNDGESEDKRWDLNKAATLADSIKKNGRFDREIKRRDDYRFHNNENFRRDIADIGDDELSGNKIDELIKSRDDIFKHNKLANDRNIDEGLQSLEELYDLNPEAFAKMPTEEFITELKDYYSAKNSVRGAEVHIKWLNDDKSELEKRIQKRQMISHDELANILEHIYISLHLDYTSTEEVDEKFGYNNNEVDFDRSPRQVMEGYQKVIDEYVATLEPERAEAQQHFQAILDKYKPATSAA